MSNETSHSIDDARMNSFLRKVVVFSAGGSFLDGYVLSIIGVALVQLVVHLNLSATDSAAIGAAAMVGILVGSLIGGRLTDSLGRRTMFIIDITAIGLASIACVFISEVWHLVALRFLMGVFIGADYPIATSLIAEFVPRKQRATGMGTVSAAWYLGATVAAFVGFALINVDGGWRWMLGSGIIPCVALLIGRHNIPESPRWLAQRGRVEEAKAVLARVYTDQVDLIIEDNVATKTDIRKIFHKGYFARILFLGLLILCQVVPMFAMYTFGPSILAALGLGSGSTAILGEAVISTVFLIGSIPAMFWLNSFGRRKLLIGSLALMALGLLIPGVAPAAPIIVIIIAFSIYAFFSGGPGILQWLYPNELFPTDIRASAVGMAIAISRVGTIISTYGLPIFLERFGIGATMLVGCGLLVLALVLSIFMAPETRQLTLNQASALPDTGNASRDSWIR